jgi:hypothetical protein
MKVEETKKKDKIDKGVKILFYTAWILISVFYIGSLWFINYGTIHPIYNNPSPGVDFYTFRTYTIEDMGFIIYPIIGWFGITFVLMMTLEEKLREKIVYSMQRIWSRVSRRRASN